ncbi:MAG TPA: GAF and ANTAR domain-containing protein [Acidimicrobiales bacterium]|nr:GAF and ANTAR domain-containing protein [Acidimicrobiales bacterium]
MPNQALLVRTLVELADNLVDDFDVVELLSLLSDRCVATLDVTAAGVMLAAPSGALQVVASSSDAMRTLELFQLQADEGPCIEAYRTGEAVVNVDLAAQRSRWPDFAPQATGQGFHSAHSLPMRLRGRTLGALNMLHTEAGPFDETDIAAAQALADIATIAIMQHQVILDAQALNAQLSGALHSRVVIEQAKGKIAQACDTDMQEAFRRLRSHARGHNLRLSDLAEQIAGGALHPRSLDVPPIAR